MAASTLAMFPVLIVFAPLIMGFHNGTGAWALDFNGNFVTPARDIIHGISPYHTASDRPGPPALIHGNTLTASPVAAEALLTWTGAVQLVHPLPAEAAPRPVS